MAAKKYTKREVLEGLPQPKEVPNEPLEKELEGLLKGVRAGEIQSMGMIAVHGDGRIGCSWLGGDAPSVVLGANNLIASIVKALFVNEKKGN